MSIYRKKNKGGKRQKFFTAEFVYRGAVHRKGGFVDREHAKDWVDAESKRLRRGSTGYVKPMVKSPVVPLVKRFTDQLAEDGCDEKYVYVADVRLRRLIGECGWTTLEHVTARSLDAWKAGVSEWKGRAIGARTKNQFIATAKAFGAWLVKPAGLLPSNPLADVEPLAAKHNDEYRRAGTVDELNKVLAACGNRRAFYLFRIYQSGLRGRTVAAMRWAWVKLDASPPFVMVPAEWDKSRKPTKYVLRLEIAQELRRERKRTKGKADDRVFPDAPTLADFRADLDAAGVPFQHANRKGRLDYHALRSTLVQLGKNAGLTAFQIMELVGHRDINTTLKWYNKTSVPADVGAAMERLPTLGKVRRAE